MAENEVNDGSFAALALTKYRAVFRIRSKSNKFFF